MLYNKKNIEGGTLVEKIYLISNFEKIFIITIYTYFTYIMFTGYSKKLVKEYFIFLIYSLINAGIYIQLIKYIHPLFAIQVTYLLLVISICLTLKQNFRHSLLAMIISFLYTYIVYWVSALISGIIILLTFSQVYYKDPKSLVLIPIVMSMVFYLMSRVKRFKNGLNFLRNTKNIHKIGKFANIIFIIGMTLFRNS